LNFVEFYTYVYWELCLLWFWIEPSLILSTNHISCGDLHPPTYHSSWIGKSVAPLSINFISSFIFWVFSHFPPKIFYFASNGFTTLIIWSSGRIVPCNDEIMSSLSMWKETYKKCTCHDILFHSFGITGQQLIMLLIAHKLTCNIWNYMSISLGQPSHKLITQSRDIVGYLSIDFICC